MDMTHLNKRNELKTSQNERKKNFDSQTNRKNKLTNFIEDVESI